MVSTSSHTNLPEVYDQYPNSIHLDQLLLYVERLPETVQKGTLRLGLPLHCDLRNRLSLLHRFRLLLPTVAEVRPPIRSGSPYGVQLDIYFPRVAQGMNVRIGRFISVPGIEAQLAPNNYIFSHSILYFVDPFTDTGEIATIKLSDQWLMQAGVTDGHDVAPWTNDAQPSGTLCVNYTTHSVNDNIYACANGINDGDYGFDNLQQFDIPWYHRFTKTVHIATESWYMYQHGVPNIAGRVANAIPPELGTYGASCPVACSAARHRICHRELFREGVLFQVFSFLSLRGSQRSPGAAHRLHDQVLREHAESHQVDRNHHPDPAGAALRTCLRLPRLRWGRTHSQFTAASDLIFHF